MARGFDSKAVSDQQEEAERRREQRDNARRPDVSPRRRTLELARADLQRRLEAAPEAMKPSLRKALADLEAMISKA